MAPIKIGASWLKGINKISRQLTYGSGATVLKSRWYRVLSNCWPHTGKNLMVECCKSFMVYVLHIQQNTVSLDCALFPNIKYQLAKSYCTIWNIWMNWIHIKIYEWIRQGGHYICCVVFWSFLVKVLKSQSSCFNINTTANNNNKYVDKMKNTLKKLYLEGRGISGSIIRAIIIRNYSH